VHFLSHGSLLRKCGPPAARKPEVGTDCGEIVAKARGARSITAPGAAEGGLPGATCNVCELTPASDVFDPTSLARVAQVAATFLSILRSSHCASPDCPAR